MHPLDLRTVFFTALAANTICTLVLLELWRQNRGRFSGMAIWAVDFGLLTTGILLIALRGSIHDWISIVVANAFVICGAVLGYEGLLRFTGQRLPQYHNWVLLGVFVPLHSWLTFGLHDVTLRTLNTSVFLLIVCGQCAWLLLRRVETAMRPLTRLVGWVFIGYCLMSLLRIMIFFLQPHGYNDYFQAGTTEVLIHIAYLLLSILLTYSLTLMVNQRLLVKIALQEEKFSMAFHSSPYAIMLTRLSDGRILEANQGFVKMTGFARDEVLGNTSNALHLWFHPEDRDGMVEALRQKGKIEGMERSFRLKDGATMIGLYSAETVRLNGEDCILSIIFDITERKRAEEERERLISEREKALTEAKTLSGLLPICARCKKIRDDKGYWNQIEAYICSHSQAAFSHGICPDCMTKLYPELSEQLKDQESKSSK